MVWKNGKTCFHTMELFPKLVSMTWKTGESGFHGVENSCGARFSGFHEGVGAW
jgi:hypothetical protein